MARKNKGSKSTAEKSESGRSAPAKQTEANEIDDIFSTKAPRASTSKAAAADEHNALEKAETSNAATSTQTKSSNKRKKRKQSSPAPPPDASTPAVKEFHDPSVALLAQSNKKQKLSSAAGPNTLDQADADLFDSRGTKRKSNFSHGIVFGRKTYFVSSGARTEDGLPIYSVEELKIGLGGDTPECPFDCHCCK